MKLFVCDSPKKKNFSVQITMPTGYHNIFFYKISLFWGQNILDIECADSEKKFEFDIWFKSLECALQDGHKSFACIESHNYFDMPAPYWREFYLSIDVDAFLKTLTFQPKYVNCVK